MQDSEYNYLAEVGRKIDFLRTNMKTPTFDAVKNKYTSVFSNDSDLAVYCAHLLIDLECGSGSFIDEVDIGQGDEADVSVTFKCTAPRHAIIEIHPDNLLLKYIFGERDFREKERNRIKNLK